MLLIYILLYDYFCAKLGLIRDFLLVVLRRGILCAETWDIRF